MACLASSSCAMVERLIHLTIVFLIMFGLLFLLVTTLSPGHHALREPSVSRPSLAISSRQTFRIAIFADLHFGEEEDGWGIDQDINSTRVMRAVLDAEHPDLVVVNGDLITGENTFRENSSAYVDQVVAPMLERYLPWASTYGNHDSKFNLSREALYRAESAYSLCYTNRMEPSLPGITNYYLVVNGVDDKPAAILWFFDSRGGSSYQHEPANVDDISNWVAPETAAWFAATHKRLKGEHGGAALPSIAFVHIPPHPFLQAQQASLDPARFPGLNADVPVDIEGQGSDDDEFVAALLATENLHSVHVGHDHGDSWCATWPGYGPGSSDGQGSRAPFLCFGKHTGYGGYGNWRRGARVLELKFSGEDGLAMGVESWVRMEDKSVITHVALNETYGTDSYPTATGE